MTTDEMVEPVCRRGDEASEDIGAAPPGRRARRTERRTLRDRLAVVALVVSALFLAACGAGEGPSAAQTASTSTTVATTSTTLSRDGWIAQVNALCTQHNDALGQVIGPLFA